MEMAAECSARIWVAGIRGRPCACQISSVLGHEERRTLAFRDFLREHGDVAQEYVTLKKHLATLVNAEESSSREAYANAKSEFIDRVIQIALAAGLPRGL